MHFLFKVIVLIIVAYISVSSTLYVLYEDFTTSSGMKHTIVNPNIYRDVLLIQESRICDSRQKEYREMMMKNIPNSTLLSTIKYIDGIEWSKWSKKMSKQNILDNINLKVQSYLQEILDRQTKDIIIINSRFHQFKIDRNDRRHLLLDYDFIVQNTDKDIADYLRILFVLNTHTNKLDIIFIKLVGEIHKDKLYVANEKVSGLNRSILSQYDISHHEVMAKEKIDFEDTFDNIKSEDEKVQNILYEKLMKSNLEEDPDYIANRIHTVNQNAVREYFTRHLKE